MAGDLSRVWPLFLLSNMLDYRFGARGSSLLSCKQNLRDMFQSITWKVFMDVVAGLTVVYYLYVGVRFYWHEVLEFFAGPGTNGGAEVKMGPQVMGGGGGGQAKQSGGAAAVPAGGVAIQGGRAVVGQRFEGTVEDSGQATLFKADGPAPGQSPELFKVMEKAITLLKAVISQGAASGMGKEELMDHFRGVLGNYGQLRGTQYEATINSFLVRTCASNFSFVLDGEMLRRLWG